MNHLIDTVKSHWRLLTAVMMVTVITLSLWPAPQLPNVPGTDKLHHLLAYAFLVMPVALCRPNGWLWVVMVLVLLSGVIELIQPYVNRYGEWLDMAANVTGVVIGIIVAKLLNHLSKPSGS